MIEREEAACAVRERERERERERGAARAVLQHEDNPQPS